MEMRAKSARSKPCCSLIPDPRAPAAWAARFSPDIRNRPSLRTFAHAVPSGLCCYFSIWAPWFSLPWYCRLSCPPALIAPVYIIVLVALMTLRRALLYLGAASAITVSFICELRTPVHLTGSPVSRKPAGPPQVLHRSQFVREADRKDLGPWVSHLFLC